MSPSDEAQTGARRGAQPLPGELVGRLEALLASEQAQQRLPSVVVGLVRDGSLVWWGARGSTGLADGRPATTDTQYRIGSISKTFVATMVMRLRDEGSLELNDFIGGHVRELAELPVTLAQLLSHTSGLRAEPAGPWWERTPGVSFADLADSTLRPTDLLWRPGRRFHYSNPGYAVLGELVARKRSAPFGEVLRDELLQPLGMVRTTLRPVAPYAEGLAVHPHVDLVLSEPEHDAVAMAPAGQLWSTIDDLTNWSEVVAGRRPEILCAESVAEMREPIGVADLPDQPWTSAYGLGLQLWSQTGRHRFGHSGGMPGHWAILLVDQASRDVVLALANSTYQGARPDFFDELLSLLASQPRPAAAFEPAAVDRRAVELTGTWYWGPVEYRISLGADGALVLAGTSPGRSCRFSSEPDGAYRGEVGYFRGERLEACRREDGSLSHLDIASFVFTRTPYDPGADIPGGIDETGWHSG